MLFVAIAEHSPSQWPGHVKEVFDRVSADMPKLPEVAQQHGVKPVGQYIMYASHKTVIVLDAPSYEAAETFLNDAGLLAWQTVELGQAHTPEEAMKNSRFAQ